MCATAAVSSEAPWSLGSFPVSYTPSRTFCHVGAADREKMGVLTEIFNRILTPLYGSQDKAISQIAEGKDRSCFLLCENGIAVGVLVFKTILSNEFAQFGVVDSIEVKSLFVDHAAQNSGKGLGSALIDKLKEEVAKLDLGQKSIHVTVSEVKTESLHFFQKKGFQVVHQWLGRYVSGVTEYLLVCPWVKGQVQAIETSVTEHLKPGVAGAAPADLVDIIHNAHLDDVHTLTTLSDNTFVSGSKDNCLYKWSFAGDCLRIVDEVEPTHRSERDWITAAIAVNDCYWVSGQRNGDLSLWRTNGDYVKKLPLKLPRLGGHVSLPENARRIHCLAAGLDPSRPSVFVGFPTMFDEYNLIEGRTESSTKVHKNDWVYCIHPLTDRKILAVVGGAIDVWEKTDSFQWRCLENLVPEEPHRGRRSGGGSPPRKQRAFISGLTPLYPSTQLFALSLFDGSIKVLDLNSKQITYSSKEHKGKVWTVENVRENLFASSGEDKVIKLWDVRERKSVRAIAGDVEVMSMRSLGEHRFVAGTSALSPGGATLRFYDFRR